MNDEIIKLILQITGATDIDEARKAAEKLEQELEQLDRAQQKAAKSSKNMGRAVLEGGRFLQDFAQGGFGGVLNNIEGLTSALGGGAGLAGVMTGLGLAAYFALPKVTALFKAIVGGSNEIPKSKDRLKDWEEQLGDANKALDKLRDKQTLTNKELADFNELTAKAARLQADLTAARRREAEFEKLRQHRGEEQQETAALVAEFVGGDIDKLRAEARGGVTAAGADRGELGRLNRSLRDAVKAQARKLAEDPNDLAGSGKAIQGQIDELRKRIAAERQRLGDEADKLVEGGLSGRGPALNNLIRFLPRGSNLRRGLEGLTPEARRAQEAEMEDEDAPGTEAFGRRAHEAGVKRRAAAAGERRFAAIMDQLKRQTEADAVAENAKRAAAAKKAEADRARKVAADKALGHQVGKEAARPAPTIPTGRLQALPENPSPLELQRAMLDNQQQMTANMQAMRAELNRARAVGRAQSKITDMGKKPSANGGY